MTPEWVWTLVPEDISSSNITTYSCLLDCLHKQSDYEGMPPGEHGPCSTVTQEVW